ncbi:hypothetical protein EEB11_02605 [Pseudotabrizicola sediminis]|uniref:MFS transporter n=1 Tax=Pseudotabrizicola sediminis TaxID=2486418 RepID=A0ABY2KRX8_9RHOB|nr:hypothetical protein [Pseudotabrizicola sediminis]TGD45441.1 hypothetical protein EEB11_02605 [Pseudotabrizicola sediminis]
MPPTSLRPALVVGLFGMLAIAALLSLRMICFVLSETLPAAQRQRFDMADGMRGAKRLLGDRAFMALTFPGGFAMASFFVFIASGPFVYTQAFGLSPTGFSLAFAVNAIGFFAASQLAAGFGQRFGAGRVVRGQAAVA